MSRIASSASPSSSASRHSAREARGAILLAAIAGLVLGLDQLTKTIVASTLGPGQANSRHDLLGEWLAIEYAENQGAAFGLLSGLGPLLVPGSVAIVLLLLAQYRRQSHPRLWQTVALGLIVGGAAGNLFDRVRLGYVVDFIAAGPWPNFNVADSAISIGVALLLWGWFRGETGSGSAERV